MTTTIRGTDNSAAAPALTGNDSDTGVYFPAANKLGLVTGGTERVIVDDLGNVGIGTGTPGARIEATASGAAVQILNRTTSDGNILELEKDGTTVGSIGANSGNPYFVKATGGIQVQNTRLLPADSSGAGSDGVSDLGRDISRWKDLYLSGSVYLGGTAAANALDDYEEGTFTPTLTAEVNPTGTTYNTQVGRYTKIGRMVHIEISLAINSKGTGGSGNAYVSGLPFTAATVTQNYPNFGIAMSPVTSSLTGEITGQINTGDNKVTLVYNTNTTSVLNAMQLSSIANSSDIRMSFCYLV